MINELNRAIPSSLSKLFGHKMATTRSKKKRLEMWDSVVAMIKRNSDMDMWLHYYGRIQELSCGYGVVGDDGSRFYGTFYGEDITDENKHDVIDFLLHEMEKLDTNKQTLSISESLKDSTPLRRPSWRVEDDR